MDAPTAFAELSTYRAFLERLYGFHAPMQPLLEARTAAALPALLPLPPRPALLEQDLRHLGADPATLPICSALPIPEGIAELVGTLYVIEGSALGGAVLARLATRSLGLGASTGTAYLAGDAALSSRWKLVVATIEQVGAEHGVDGIVAGAARTFDGMEAWLCR